MRVKNSLTQGIMKEYIRFGEIPKDEHSKRGNRIVGDGYKCIGYEHGVSVWNTLKVNVLMEIAALMATFHQWLFQTTAMVAAKTIRQFM